MAVFYHHADHFQYRLVVRIVKRLQIGILSVKGQGILGQVIGSDAEEIHQLGQFVTDHDCRRSLYHNAFLHILVGDLLCRQLRFHLGRNLPDGLYFFHRNDHRVHYGNIAVHRCPVKGSQLCLKNLRSGQADPDGPIAQSRIFFGRKLQIFRLLVGTDVHSPDDQLSAGQILGSLLVNSKLLFLIG